MTMTAVPTHRALCRFAALALLVAAVAHVPVTPEHLREAPYMGVAFALFTAAGSGLAMWLAWRGGRAALLSALGLCVAAVATYAATRVVAFPQLADDVGNWSELLGLVSVSSEAAVIAAAAVALRGNVAGWWPRIHRSAVGAS